MTKACESNGVTNLSQAASWATTGKTFETTFAVIEWAKVSSDAATIKSTTAKEILTNLIVSCARWVSTSHTQLLSTTGAAAEIFSFPSNAWQSKEINKV